MAQERIFRNVSLIGTDSETNQLDEDGSRGRIVPFGDGEDNGSYSNVQYFNVLFPRTTKAMIVRIQSFEFELRQMCT